MTRRVIRVNLGLAMSPPSTPPVSRGGQAEPLDLVELAEAVTSAARGLRYGSIEVLVHDAHVVQIIRTEKRRMAR